MKLTAAKAMVDAAIAYARSKSMSRLAIVVLDARGALKVAVAEDGTSLKRSEVAIGKAHGALAMGLDRARSTRGRRASRHSLQPSRTRSALMVPVPGGVLPIRTKDGELLGAIGSPATVPTMTKQPHSQALLRSTSSVTPEPEMPELARGRDGHRRWPRARACRRSVSCASSSAGPICAFHFPRTFRRAARGARGSNGLTRRAKYILAHLDDGEVLIVHLGMTGRFTMPSGRRPKPASARRIHP